MHFLLNRSLPLALMGLTSLICVNALASESMPAWLQTRDQNPFALATGLPLAPSIPAAGRWQFDATFNVANTELEQSDSDSLLLFDAETHETRFSAAYGVSDAWSVRASISHLAVGSGFLDGAIERFHSAFGFDNGDRGLLGTQSPSIIVRSGDETLYSLDQNRSGAGPLLVDLSRTWQLNNQGVAGISVGAKWSTGNRSNLSDSGSTDASMSAFGVLPFGERWTFGARAGVLVQNNNHLLGELARTRVPFASVLLRYRLGENWSALLQTDAHGPLYRNLPDFLGSTSNQLNIGLSRQFGDNAELQATLGEDLPALHTADVVITFNLRVHPKH